jgi:hypothetical protein
MLNSLQQGLEAAKTEGTISQAIAEQHLSKWLIPWFGRRKTMNQRSPSLLP